jgi:hypothetical protein
MEYVDGGDLESHLRNKGRLHWKDALKVAYQVASALRHAHNSNILHRDLKPSNLLVNDAGIVKLTDFGLARLLPHPTGSAVGGVIGSIIGSMAYMAPEIATGKPATKRSDFYAFGGVLYTLITGRPPFTGSNLFEIIHKHCYTLPERPIRIIEDLPEEIDDLICRMLAKDPTQRIGEGGLFLQELERIRGKLERRGQLDQGFRPPVAPGEEADDPLPALGPLQSIEQTSTIPPPVVSRPWTQRPWVVIPAFLIVVSIIVAAFAWPKPSAEELFAQAEPLLASENPDDWQRAWDDFLEPLQRYHPDKYSDEITLLRQKLDAQGEFNRAFAQAKLVKYHSEAERFYFQGLKLCQAGELASARRVWSNLIVVFENIESARTWVKLASQGVQRINTLVEGGQSDQPRILTDSATIRDQIEQTIRQLVENGNLEQANKIRQSLKELNLDNKDAEKP